jgi:hypothetical protein
MDITWYQECGNLIELLGITDFLDVSHHSVF